MAAPFQNYSGGVLLADIVKRNNLSTYVAEAIKERSQFIKSGAVVRNALLDAREGMTTKQWVTPSLNSFRPVFQRYTPFFATRRVPTKKSHLH